MVKFAQFCNVLIGCQVLGTQMKGCCCYILWICLSENFGNQPCLYKFTVSLFLVVIWFGAFHLVHTDIYALNILPMFFAPHQKWKKGTVLRNFGVEWLDRANSPSSQLNKFWFISWFWIYLGHEECVAITLSTTSSKRLSSAPISGYAAPIA